MDEWIRTADGTTVENAYVVKMDGRIAIYGEGEYTFGDVYSIFGNAENTATIHSEQYGDVEDWVGYTVLTSINITEEGFTVCLSKEETYAS